jgi:pyruvate dehydrogenase E2 component (dihydrolipoamide acetyltransferase)
MKGEAPEAVHLSSLSPSLSMENVPKETNEAGALPHYKMNSSKGVPAVEATIHEKLALAAPMVRRRARELGIDLALVQGSGPGGRVLLEDLEQSPDSEAALSEETDAIPERHSELIPQYSSNSPTSNFEAHTLSSMRAAIARTVDKSWRTIPHFSVTMEVRMDLAEEIRRELKRSNAAVSINDMVIKGAALALQKFPMANASFAADSIIVFNEINIGIAVSQPDGLLVPVIKGCQSLSLREIAIKSRDLVTRGRSGHISEAEISGGTFTISNLGMYGVSQFSAVILPPQAAILAVGAVGDSVIMKNGQPATARIMRVTLSADHRVLDGAYAAGFLGEFKKILESPVKLLL